MRWAGSKRRLIPTLRPFWERSGCTRYVEPFAGSACLFFDIEPKEALLGDVNGELIDAYRAIQRSAKSVHSAMSQWGEDSESFYAIRALDPASLQLPDRAARFLHLNRLCFNGLFRTNRAGRFNVPYGGRKTTAPPSLVTLRNVGRVLRRAALVRGDFDRVLRRVESSDFVFMDPPYRVSTRRVFREYHAGEFSDEDLVRLRRWLESFATMGVAFVVTYADSPEGRWLGEGFSSQRIRVRRNIAGFAGNRRNAYELLISNS